MGWKSKATCENMMLIWIKISKECFQQFVYYILRRMQRWIWKENGIQWVKRTWKWLQGRIIENNSFKIMWVLILSYYLKYWLLRVCLRCRSWCLIPTFCWIPIFLTKSFVLLIKCDWNQIQKRTACHNYKFCSINCHKSCSNKLYWK